MVVAPQSGLSVRTSPEGGVFVRKYPALAYIPYIVDTACAFHRLANRFLIERGLAVWHPKTRLERRPWRIPSPRSLRNYADWLVNFLEWAERRGIDLVNCEYSTHILGRYQPDMLEGRWSRDGRKLGNISVNLRVNQACDYLVWLHDRGLRDAFDVPYTLVEILIRGHLRMHGRKKVVKRRQGSLRQVTKALRMPDDQSLRAWLAAIYAKFGQTFGLICETILLTAMRREEVLSLPKDLIPENPAEWDVVNAERPRHQQQIRLTISHGAKGKWTGYTPHRTKVGPEREILVPLTLAEKWHEYRRNERNAAFAIWMKSASRGGRTKQQHAKLAGCLFLDETTGAKITGPALYYRWTDVPPPVPGWSVHDGRNWWACAKLWRALKSKLKTLDLGSETDLAILQSAGRSTIQLEIVPQLGHVDESSVKHYLKWLTEMISVPVSITEGALS